MQDPEGNTQKTVVEYGKKKPSDNHFRNDYMVNHP